MAKAAVHLPEKQQYSHEKGLEIVVPTELSVVVYSYLPKCLEAQQREFKLPNLERFSSE